MSLEIVILAAGQGKRMYSALPKVLHPLAGKPMLSWVVEAAEKLNPNKIHIIYGHNGEKIKASLGHLAVNWILQSEQLGTGHALQQALAVLSPDARVLVLSGDVPLIQPQTLKALIAPDHQENFLNLLVAELSDPQGLGRIIRDEQGAIVAIVEDKDASEKQRLIKEIYTGICSTSTKNLRRWLPQLKAHNAQKEYYLTDIIAMAVSEQMPISSVKPPDNVEIQGVNTRLQLQELERSWQKTMANRLLLSGVSLADANRLDIRGELHCKEDVYIDVNAIFEGKVRLEKGCRIGPNCVLSNVTIGENSEIFANSVLEDCIIGKDCAVGPFARIRPGTELQAHCKIGNFVETKNAVLAEGTKASHLSYLGDVTIGKDVNIGAGTITCNYDGANKHQTIIEDGVFVGSDTQFIAPVRIGAHATIGAGSTIRKDVPPGELTLTVTKQRTVFGWERPVKKNHKE